MKPTETKRAYFKISLLASIATILCLSCSQQNSEKTTAARNTNDNEVPINEKRELISETPYPVIYNSIPSLEGQWGFQTVPANRLKVKLIPNISTCSKLKLDSIENIFGVNQFLLDMDFTTGFVHHYTTNFFNKLRPDDYVLKIDKTTEEVKEGDIFFIKKKNLLSGDVLGKNIAFFRQWKLSEIDINSENIKMAKCGFCNNCSCPQAKVSTGNPFSTEIPISNTGLSNGYQPITKFNLLGNHDGGTAVIIWEDPSTKQVIFKDVHASLFEIIEKAKSILATYSVDPVIAISDAGIVSRKFRSDKNFVLDLAPIKQLSPNSQIAAGYGYVPMKMKIYKVFNGNIFVKNDTTITE